MCRAAEGNVLEAINLAVNGETSLFNYKKSSIQASFLARQEIRCNLQLLLSAPQRISVRVKEPRCITLGAHHKLQT